MRKLALVVCGILAAAGAGLTDAADRTILGKSFVVKDPAAGVDPTLRTIAVVGKESASPDVIVGDPLANGVSVEVIAAGPTRTTQTFVLPPGPLSAGSAGWKATGNPVVGYTYRDSAGVNGPVRSATIKKAGGTFSLRLDVRGSQGPGPQPHVTVVPPNPGDAGGIRFTVNGGDTYCVNFGLAAGGRVTNRDAINIAYDALFKITSGAASPTTEAGCPRGATQWYVDATTGADANAGDAGAPFRTIAHALSLSAGGDTVLVAPGTYDAANGEVFPLGIPTGVVVLGDETTKGSSTIISGGGAPTNPPTGAVDLSDHSTLAGFTVTNVTSSTGVVVFGNGATVRNDSLVNSPGAGLLFWETSRNGLASGNFLSGNAEGVEIADLAGSGARLEGNVVTGNSVFGVSVAAGGEDLGGGAAGSAGGNTFSCNGSYDLHVASNVAVDAQNDFWDHSPPTTAVAPDATPVDILLLSAGSSVNAAGSQLAGSPCP